jgi:hypothetical protein
MSHRLTLDIDSTEPFGGHLTGDDGRDYPFAGWSGLAAAIMSYISNVEFPVPETLRREGEQPPS